MRALALKDVRFRYRGSPRWALDGVSLEVEQGEFVTLLGANGSGKSTICLLANGLVPHALPGDLEGQVHVFGMDARAHKVSELATRVGIVFQEPESQLFCMSVEEEVAFGPENLAVPPEQIRERVDWALEVVGMKGYKSRSPFSLSGGEKQRVAIAAALSMRPDMLVLDEPAYALDPMGRTELYSLLEDLKERHQVTVLLAERDAEEAAVFSDRVVLMKDGRNVDSGTPEQMLKDVNRVREIGIVPPQLSEVRALLDGPLGLGESSFLTVDEAERAISTRLAGGKQEGRRR